MGLFKYYSPKNYNFDAFCKNQIFFSKPSNLNDPFDTSDLLVKPYEKFCSKVDLNKNNLFESFGVCCFTKSEKANNRHLWSLYADSYRGYALEFDEAKFDSKYYRPLHLMEVKYGERPFNLNDFSNSFISEDGKDYTVSSCIEAYTSCMRDYMPLERLFQHLLLYKDSSIWEVENEYRMIMGKIKPSHWEIIQLDTGYLLTLSSPDTVKSITVGQFMPDDNKRKLQTCADHKNIPIYEAIPCVENNMWGVKIIKLK